MLSVLIRHSINIYESSSHTDSTYILTAKVSAIGTVAISESITPTLIKPFLVVFAFIVPKSQSGYFLFSFDIVDVLPPQQVVNGQQQLQDPLEEQNYCTGTSPTASDSPIIVSNIYTSTIFSICERL